MKKVAFYLRKGGTGKSSSSMMVSHMIARMGKKVVLVDVDTQGTATLGYLGHVKGFKELSNVLEGKCYLDEALIEVRPNLFLLPTDHMGSQSNLTKYAESKLSNEYYAFDDIIEELVKLQFDFAIFDMSPADGLLERRVIKSMDEIIAVTAPAYFETGGLARFRRFIEDIQKIDRSKVKFGKILINKINGNIGDHKDFTNEIKSIAMQTYDVKTDARIGKAQKENKSVVDLLDDGVILNSKIEEDRSLSGINKLVKDLVEGA